jgi:hypothetical protein
MTSPRHRLDSADWFGKTAAGLVLGFSLALAVSGLCAWLTPGGIAGGNGKIQFVMWLIAPLWAGVLCFVFLFRDGRRAWCWLAVANLLAFGLLAGVRGLLG